jgi:hypothetical protein
MAGLVPAIHVFAFRYIHPHPEEVTSVTVSKEDPVRSGSSFETPAAQAPQDEGEDVMTGLEDVDHRLKAGDDVVVMMVRNVNPQTPRSCGR